MPDQPTASPYATGGGGVRLEHRYAATLFAAMLAGDPVSELGDDAAVDVIRLQASDVSAVDDIVIDGRDFSGELRRASIGVRRNPGLTTSDTESVPLIRAFLKVVTEHWDDAAAGRWRLVLAVGIAGPGAREAGELAGLAHSADSHMDFAASVSRGRATNAGIRSRLSHLTALVTAARSGVASLETVDVAELTWRWLHVLQVRLLRLEGADNTDRTGAVSSLRHALADHATATADAAFGTLAEAAGAWASTGTRVTQAQLRSALSAYSLAGGTRYARAWEIFRGLARRVREATRPDLHAEDGTSLELPRAAERTSLIAAANGVSQRGGTLVVTGEPDVGKSALTLRVAESLRDETGAAVLTFSLRDLPERVVDVEHLLGAPVPEVLAASATAAPGRLLVIDGAEAVLEGRSDVLREFATGAATAGIGVIVVTRTDAAGRVTEVLREVAAASDAPPPTQHTVARLTAPERRTLVETFRSLGRLDADTRVEWLVGRPGLVDVLLQAGGLTDTTNLLSEADVYAAVWNGLIRNREGRVAEVVYPDDREAAAVAAARRAMRLPTHAVPAGAAASLRSDGVLRAAANPALSAGDEFTSDLLRDFALCRLFVLHGWGPLEEADWPRWAIRAVRLACQARLHTGDRVRTWREMRDAFTGFAEWGGERWAEVPIEALLTLADAEQAITDLWDDLTVDDGAGLRTLLRLAELRHVTAEVGDPHALAPVVATTFCSDADLGQNDQYGRWSTVGRAVRNIVLAYLRGLAVDRTGPDRIRQRIRDVIISRGSAHPDPFAVEAIATLGPDLDAAAETWLRDVAARSPQRLREAVEPIATMISLSTNRPRLLLDLTQAYYIEQPDPDDRWGGHLRDNGIRDMGHGRGLGHPFAAWYFGPFYRLLMAVTVDAVAMINRMLDHAALHRFASRTHAWGVSPEGPEGAVPGFTLDLPGIGERLYVGDAGVWCWYRSSTVGPYPCMSALLAVEKFADQLIDEYRIPLRTVVDLLLRDCHNLAMPGLVYGLLVRRAEQSEDLLDAWLSHPEVWSLEASRVAHEHWHAHADDADVPGHDRRRHSARDVAVQMTFRAAGDPARLDALATVGERLVAKAKAGLADTDGEHRDDRLAVVEAWASAFSLDSYHLVQADDGTVVVEHRPPERVTRALAASDADLLAGRESIRLQVAYGHRNDDPGGWPADQLLHDLAAARQLQAAPPTMGAVDVADPVTAVAAAAIAATAAGGVGIPAADIMWASETVIAAATTAGGSLMSFRESIYPMGADRAAAKVAPQLLLAPFDKFGLDQPEIEQALMALGVSPYNEVRLAFALACGPVLEAPCAADASGACRRHRPLWAVAMASLAHCRLGAWDFDSQRRAPASLQPPYDQSLPQLDAQDLALDRLALPLLVAADAVSARCLRDEATTLRPVLMDAHRRALDHDAREGQSDFADPQREAVARLLIRLASAGDTEPLVGHLQALAGNADGLHHLLRDLAVLFTYEDELRPALTEVWPAGLEALLDAIDAGARLLEEDHWADWAIAAMLPTPNIRTNDPTPDETLARARGDWIQPDALAPLIDRWIALAAGDPKAADAVAQLARSAPMAWQTEAGLSWLTRVVDRQYGRLANHCWYVTEWLRDIHGHMPANRDSLGRWRHLVDGLASAGDRGAVNLQRLDE